MGTVYILPIPISTIKSIFLLPNQFNVKGRAKYLKIKHTSVQGHSKIMKFGRGMYIHSNNIFQ